MIPIKYFRLIALQILLFSSLMTGCSSVPLVGNPQRPYPPTHPPEVGDVFHIPTGTFVDESQMLDAATDARIVYVGETHDNLASHRLQLKVLKSMTNRWPEQVAMGMEMFTPEQQQALDDWVAGKLTEQAFIKASRWKEVWHMNFDYYKPLLLFAREQGIPIVGLNAPKHLVRAVGRNDLSKLTENERQQIPKLDTPAPYRRAMIDAIYGGHAEGNNRLDAFQRVQALWDETMADNIVRYLTSPDGQNRRMMVIAGSFHVRHGLGIPRAVYKRLPTSYVLIGSRELIIPEEKKDQRMDVQLPKLPMPPYDYITYVKYESLKEQANKITPKTD